MLSILMLCSLCLTRKCASLSVSRPTLYGWDPGPCSMKAALAMVISKGKGQVRCRSLHDGLQGSSGGSYKWEGFGKVNLLVLIT